MLEPLGQRASAIGYPRVYAIRQSTETIRLKLTDLRFPYASTEMVPRCAIVCHCLVVDAVGGWTSAQPAEARVSILLYDALDFSTYRDDGGGQTRESLSRIASPSAAVAGLVLRPGVCGTERLRENLWSRMSKPKRIQRSRSKGWKMPANAIYIGRPTV
jgi:hypothetical protein